MKEILGIKMKKILVLKTSTDATMHRLFEEIKDNEIVCLIQPSQIDRYRKRYPNIKFIDILKEGFYDLPEDVMLSINGIVFDELYVTYSGIVGHNYGNVMAIVDKIDRKKAFFYNINGDKVEIPVFGKMRNLICRLYIKMCELIY